MVCPITPPSCYMLGLATIVFDANAHEPLTIAKASSSTNSPQSLDTPASTVSGVTSLIVRKTSSAIAYATSLLTDYSPSELLSIAENAVHYLS